MCQIWAKSRSDWPETEQIRDFFILDVNIFWLTGSEENHEDRFRHVRNTTTTTTKLATNVTRTHQLFKQNYIIKF